MLIITMFILTVNMNGKYEIDKESPPSWEACTAAMEMLNAAKQKPPIKELRSFCVKEYEL